MDPFSLAIVCLTFVALAAIGAGSHSTARKALDVFKLFSGVKTPKSK